MKTICHVLVIHCLVWPVVLVGQSTTNHLDPFLVQQKIHALSIRDDTIPPDQQPRAWLAQNREQISSQLIAAMDDPNTNTAAAVLAILNQTHASPILANALIRIVSETNHPLSQAAMFSLCRFVDDARAQTLLTTAIHDATRFPKPEDRATFAEAIGDKQAVVELLTPVLNQRDEFLVRSCLKRLGATADPSAIAPLETASQHHDARIAGNAYLILAELDPQHHALTPSQTEFLKYVSHGHGKAGKSFFQKRSKELAALPRSELRPFVMQFLINDSASHVALDILRIWRDKDALPVIRQLLHKCKPYSSTPFVTAYLEIDDSETSTTEVCALITSLSDVAREFVMRGVAEADLPSDRKLKLLRQIRDQLGSQDPYLVPHALRDQNVIASQMFAEETNPKALGAYAEQLKDGGTNALLRAARLIVAAPKKDPHATRIILECCAAFGIVDSGKYAGKLLTCPNMEISIAAAGVTAKFGAKRTQALKLLHTALAEHEQAAQTLLGLPCLNAKERDDREAAVLNLIGTPGEELALRVLPTCGGAKTTVALQKLLDDPNITRAIHAAWVLAQLPDKAAAQQALRRVAIFGLFHRNNYQQGEGIDFPIARGLFFHQTTMWLNPEQKTIKPPEPVVIPSDLMLPRELNTPEQTFSIRAYRISAPTPSFQWYVLKGDHGNFDQSYLPLLRVIAVEDPTLEVLHVLDQSIAHFPQRKAAASAIAKLTTQPATYRGLAGEELDSTTVPRQPYQDQSERIAKYALDLISAWHLSGRPQTDAEWQERGRVSQMLDHLTDACQFGNSLQQALLDEAKRRGLTEKYKDAGLSLWQ